MAPSSDTLTFRVTDIVSPNVHAPYRSNRKPPVQSPPVEFHLTGFARFFNVSANPTEDIVHALPHYLEKFPLSSNARLASATVLQVAAKTVSEHLDKMYMEVAKSNRLNAFPKDPLARKKLSNKKPRTVFIHLGVNMNCTQFLLEWKAKNEATFSCPDELGWTPMRHPIDPDDDDIMCTRQTSLALCSLLNNLADRGHSVSLSHDAGRFICNWTYFNSLKLARRHDAHALFVHVPPVSIIPIDQQVQFIADLLKCIAQL